MSDCKRALSGIPVRYLHGNLEDAIKKCDQNFTYIFSDVELVKQCSKILLGTYAHVLLAMDYRYNYIDNGKTFKYNLHELALSHPFVRIGTTLAGDKNEVLLAFRTLTTTGGG
jgi:hypothetical protein